jgi:hypothetical protein
VSGAFEGDLMRPLGHVTLYFGYLEADVNGLIKQIQDSGVSVDVLPGAPLGQRLTQFAAAVKRLPGPAAAEVLALLEESKVLVDRRNNLIHAGIYAKGIVIPNDPTKPKYSVTPESLTELAELAFSWKGRLSAAIQLRLLPSLRKGGGNGT